MEAHLDSWKRERFVAGGGDALVLFAVYGTFRLDGDLPGATYRTQGVPKGITLSRLDRATLPEFPFTDDAFLKTAGQERADLFERTRQAPECMLLRGEVPDPPNLDYLRDSIGVVMYLLDHGGIAAMDPQAMRLHDPSSWREDLFDPWPPAPSRHVTILVSEEPDGSKWFHTRGLRKFGRPDLSVHRVPHAREEAVIGMLQRFIVLQTKGDRIPDGQEIRMAGLPPGLICRHAGSKDDPDFNNVRVEIG